MIPHKVSHCHSWLMKMSLLQFVADIRPVYEAQKLMGVASNGIALGGRSSDGIVLYDASLPQVRIANAVPGSGSLDRVFSDTALVWHR